MNNPQFRLPPFPRLPGPRRERGTMLIIALIVLVAMTLAGIATMRSVDTATLVAGNVGFRQATVNAADEGIQAAYAWLLANQNVPTTMQNDSHTPPNSLGYYSSVGATDSNWRDNTVWVEAALVNGGVPDAGSNVVSYRIERLCKFAGQPPGGTNPCGSTQASTAAGGGTDGADMSNPNFFKGNPYYHFRVTVRALGPRGSVAFVQTMLRGMN